MESNLRNQNCKDTYISQGLIYGLMFGAALGQAVFHNAGMGIGFGISAGVFIASLLQIRKDHGVQLRPAALLLGAFLGAAGGALLGLAVGFLHGAHYAVYGPGPVKMLWGLPFKPEYLPLTVPLTALMGMWWAHRKSRG